MQLNDEYFNTLLRKENNNLTNVLGSTMFANENDINSITSFCSNLALSSGALDQHLLNDKIRKSKIAWIPKNNESKILYDMIAKQVDLVNTSNYGFRLDGFYEQIQYSEYCGDGGHYDWHVDIGAKNTQFRKISVVIQLSNPEDYEGGNLEIFSKPNHIIAPRDKGSMIFFPSYLLHRVTPVTKGLRKSLAIWVSGPPFS